MSIATKPRVLEGVRWSSFRDCPRRAAFEADDCAPDRQRTEQEELILLSGQAIEDIYVRRLQAKHGAENVIRQREIEWPFGTGHADAFVVPTGTMIEVYSSYKPASAAIDSKLLQLVGYMEHDPECKSGALVILNPRDFAQDTHKVVKGTERYEELVAECHERIEQVRRWKDGEGLPPRVCAKPSEARSHFCLFAETCFQGWEPEPLPELEAKLVPLAKSLSLAKKRELLAKKAVQGIEEDRKEIETELAGMLDPGTYEADGVKLTRTHVTRETFSLKKARLAGIPEHVLSEHTNVSEYDTWKVSAPDEHEPEDYGSAPF